MFCSNHQKALFLITPGPPAPAGRLNEINTLKTKRRSQSRASFFLFIFRKFVYLAQMSSMAVFSQAQYDALLAAVATGSKVVQYSDKRVEYRTLNEMLSLLNLMAQDLGLTVNLNNSGRRIAEFNDGYETEGC